jgi:hypothetical protein
MFFYLTYLPYLHLSTFFSEVVLSPPASWELFETTELFACGEASSCLCSSEASFDLSRVFGDFLRRSTWECDSPRCSEVQSVRSVCGYNSPSCTVGI